MPLHLYFHDCLSYYTRKNFSQSLLCSLLCLLSTKKNTFLRVFFYVFSVPSPKTKTRTRILFALGVKMYHQMWCVLLGNGFIFFSIIICNLLNCAVDILSLYRCRNCTIKSLRVANKIIEKLVEIFIYQLREEEGRLIE